MYTYGAAAEALNTTAFVVRDTAPTNKIRRRAPLA